MVESAAGQTWLTHLCVSGSAVAVYEIESAQFMLRFALLVLSVVLTLCLIVLGFALGPSWFWPLLLTLPLALTGIADLAQSRHSLLRNYPILAHLRWMFEGIRPEVRQYLIEGDEESQPFNRDQRSLVYQRAKNQGGLRAFGSKLDFYENRYDWLNHSVVPSGRSSPDYRLVIGGERCTKKYSASVYNISAMSFGALGRNAILALNKGAKAGNFAHDTGEGGISRYHRVHGGDLIWEIGSGYFGCRNRDGSFDPDRFAEQATDDQVRLIELKLSQGAKPGHGGILPAAKLTPEIADARGVEPGKDCVSPTFHSVFRSPRELIEFIDRMRDMSGGKPTGFKLCIGHRWEFLAICKAMIESGIEPDFIVIDGAEGGTGAAPEEFVDRMGTPLFDGLSFAHNALIGAGLRDRIKLGASGKIISAVDIGRAMSLGADWCNSARGFMFALGCIQAQICHTNRCPVGVTTQDPWRQRALVVPDKAERVHRFHYNTLRALSEVLDAVGVSHPGELRPGFFSRRAGGGSAQSGEEVFPRLEPGELIAGTRNPAFARYWKLARSDSFAPAEALSRS